MTGISDDPFITAVQVRLYCSPAVLSPDELTVMLNVAVERSQDKMYGTPEYSIANARFTHKFVAYKVLVFLVVVK